MSRVTTISATKARNHDGHYMLRVIEKWNFSAGWQDSIDQLHDAVSARAARHDPGDLFDLLQRIRNRDRQPAHPEKLDVVLRVADADDAFARNAKILERRCKPRP